MKISVIIPTYNRISSLFMTLDSYYQFKEKIYEIIIIDQSKNEIKEQIEKKYQKLNIKYIHYPFPSLTKARNIGIDNLEGDIVIFSDDDIILHKYTLKNVLEIFSRNKNISLIGGLDSEALKNMKQKIKLKNIIAGLCGRKKIMELNKGNTGNGIFGNFPSNLKENTLIETDWAMGFFFCCRVENILKWNLKFDEQLVSYAYAEDLDFTQRYYYKSKEKMQKMVFTSDVVVDHKCSKEYRIPDFRLTLMYIIHRKYLVYKLKKGISGRFYCELNDFLTLIQKIYRREKIKEFIEAKVLCFKIREKIKKLEIPDEVKNILKGKS